MKKQHITQLENQLEKLIEGGFARLFGRGIQAQDIAIKLTRVMEDHLIPAAGSDPRLIAPDQYIIYTHPKMQSQLLDKYPQLGETLGGYMLELAAQMGYRLNHPPDVKILASEKLSANDLEVVAMHKDQENTSTATMQSVAIQLPGTATLPQKPQLIIDQGRIVALEQGIINIGRHPDNDIILEDHYASRHHVQLRLRQGHYMLSDVGSNSGTYINGAQKSQHELKSGDVIRIGRTTLLYLEEDDFADYLQQTDSLEPLA